METNSSMASWYDIAQRRGKSYDNGCMCVYAGVHAKIIETNKLAKFVPCLVHSLNLVDVS